MTFALGLLAALALGGLASGVRPPTLGRPNYRDRTVTLAGGLAAAVLACIGTVPTLVAAGSAAVVGAYDDLRGTPQAKGLAGHLRALRRGTVTSGAVKVAVVGTGALGAALILDGTTPRALLDAFVIAGSANLLNLFDLRPGRALKVALLAAVTTDAWLAGVAAGLLPYDLRERTMLGDTGANALGAAVGVALARHSTGVVAVVAVVVLAVTVASERVSFTRVIDGAAPLRWADRLGRTG